MEVLSDMELQFKKRFSDLCKRGQREVLAELLNVHRETISRWFDPKRPNLPSLQETKTLADFYNVSPSWLGFGEGTLDEMERHLVLNYRQADPTSKLYIQNIINALSQAPTLLPGMPGMPAMPPLNAMRGVPGLGGMSGMPGMPMPTRIPGVPNISAMHGAGLPPPIPMVSSPPKPELGAQGKYAQPNPDVEDRASDTIQGMKLKSKHFDVTAIEPAPEQHALAHPEMRTAANKDAVGAGVPIKDTEMADMKYSSKNHYVLKFVGRSMWPTMREGDKLIVKRVNYYLPIYDEDRGSCDPKMWTALDTEIVVALPDDNQLEAMIKRLEISYRRDAGFKIVLRSDNPSTKAIEIKRDNSLRIIGIVRDIMRDPKQVD